MRLLKHVREPDSVSYVLSLDGFHIYDTRSLIMDCVFLSMSAQVSAQPEQTATRFIGEVGKGYHPVNLQLGPFDSTKRIPSNLTFSYLILNSTIDLENLERESELLQEVLDSVSVATRGALTEEFEMFLPQLNIGMFENCDGLIAEDKIILPIRGLEKLTYDTDNYSETRQYKDIYYDAPWGCGTPNYTVTWTVSRQ